jgi:formylmethanofuran dehydrogenase subunit E-like metal-binding protein
LLYLRSGFRLSTDDHSIVPFFITIESMIGISDLIIIEFDCEMVARTCEKTNLFRWMDLVRSLHQTTA